MGRRMISGGWRGVVGALAIYAVVLQAMLAGLAGPPLLNSGLDPTICAPSAEHAGDRQNAPARHADHSCCLAACAAAAPPLPSVAGTLVAWPVRTAIRLAWSPADDRLATGPPLYAIHARGPPRA